MVVIAQITTRGLGRLLFGEVIDIWLLREQRGHFSSMPIQPLLATDMLPIRFLWGVNTENGVSLFIRQALVGPDVIVLQFAGHLLGQGPHLVMERALGKGQIMIAHQIAQA